MSLTVHTLDGEIVLTNVIDFFRSPSAIRVIYIVDECIVDEIFND